MHWNSTMVDVRPSVPQSQNGERASHFPMGHLISQVSEERPRPSLSPVLLCVYFIHIHSRDRDDITKSEWWWWDDEKPRIFGLASHWCFVCISLTTPTTEYKKNYSKPSFVTYKYLYVYTRYSSYIIFSLNIIWYFNIYSHVPR